MESARMERDMSALASASDDSRTRQYGNCKEI
jgi:hypothetical protein